MKHNYKLIIAYDGTNYNGWQIQPNGVSIQEIIQKQIAIILRQDVHVKGSGRTDTGVHALGQVANFYTEKPVALDKFLRSINGLLPADIRVLKITEVPEKFHPQHDAKGKIYHYNIHLGKIADPFTRLYSTPVAHELDLEKLKTAASYFIGTHDFTSFANQSHMGSAANDPVRTIRRIDVILEGNQLRLEFEGTGFLYKMVRNITGALIAVGSHKLSPDRIPAILAAKDRRQAPEAAPAQGLFLVEVIY